MKYLVSWSGGLDSTYLIYDLLKNNHSVKAVYTELTNNAAKTERETSSINKIISKNIFAENFEYIKGSSISIEATTDGIVSLYQPLPFLLSLYFMVDDSIDYVAIGAVMGDDLCSYIDDLKAIWASFEGISHNNNKMLPLLFPLIKHSKDYMYDNIPKKIRKYCTWCEGGTFSDTCCEKNRCIPCFRMENQLGISDPYSNKKIEIKAVDSK